MQRDASLDNLLDLNGQLLVIDQAGYWVKFIVHTVPPTAHKPHGLDYPLTLHGPDGKRLIGFDNAHAVAGSAKGAETNHRHRLGTIRPYAYSDAGPLLTAFWIEVESMMREQGVRT
ncbi:MAG: hypothetical protein LH480_12510 [Rubrivivax sp.]|nr:hypothetical protein [Rubrivivax sp.]